MTNYGLYQPYFTDHRADLSFRCLECGNDEFKFDIRLDYEGSTVMMILICNQCFETFDGDFINDVKDNLLLDKHEHAQFLRLVTELAEKQEIKWYDLKKEIKNAVKVSNEMSGQQSLKEFF